MTKEKNLICRSFRQDFPEFVERAEVRARSNGRVRFG